LICLVTSSTPADNVINQRQVPAVRGGGVEVGDGHEVKGGADGTVHG
jgi:hypothetical protein